MGSQAHIMMLPAFLKWAEERQNNPRGFEVADSRDPFVTLNHFQYYFCVVFPYFGKLEHLESLNSGQYWPPTATFRTCLRV